MSFISLTENSKVYLQKFLNEGSHPTDSTYLRVAVHGISCSGPKFALYFDETYNTEHDEMFDAGGIKVVTSKSNLDTLNGYIVDYKEAGDTAGFVFENPLKTLGCSSGGGCCSQKNSCQTTDESST